MFRHQGDDPDNWMPITLDVMCTFADYRVNKPFIFFDLLKAGVEKRSLSPDEVSLTRFALGHLLIPVR
jgi:hypothetical protein